MSPVSLKQRAFFWAGMAAVLLVVYLPLLNNGTLLMRDDHQLVDPLLRILSFKGFIAFLVSAKSLDFQPVRDISLMADVALLRLTGFPTYHLHNVLLWFLCGLAAERILRRIGGNTWLTLAFTGAFLLHPMMVMSVGWIAARKHVLAFLFFLLALDAFLDWAASRRRGHLVWVCYLLSVLAQPILVFFPLWCVAYLLVQGGELRARLRSPLPLVLLGAMGALVLVNYVHYVTVYKVAPEVKEAISGGAVTPPGDMLLALGRYTWNFFVPWRYALLYSRASPLNVFGLAILVLAVFFLVKRAGRRTALLWLSLSALSLALVLTKIRNLFISDTYALTYAFVYFLLFLDIAGRASPAAQRRLIAFLSALAVFFAAHSRGEARQWESDFSLWERAFQLDGDCQSTLIFASQLLARRRPDEAIPLVHKYWAMDCPSQKYYGRFFPREAFQITLAAIFFDRSLSIADKRELIGRKNRERSDYGISLYLFALDVADGDFRAARPRLESLMKEEGRILDALSDWELEMFRPSLERFCGAIKSPACPAIREQLARRARP